MATYYISTSGNDNSGNGSIGTPWKSLHKACNSVSGNGDIIHVNAGTYTETSQCNLTVGVSIEGVGVSSHIISEVEFTRSGDLSGAAITLSSGSEGTNGNQHISNIWLDGNYFAGSYDGSSASGNDGIFVQRRSNVKIFNCTISGFYLNGIALHGTDIYQQPSTYATGNEIYNCIITDNGNEDTTWSGGGNIEIAGQGDGTLIHDNTISATGRQNHGLVNGNNLSGGHHNKGIKFYNNILNKREAEGVWSFQIEMWNTDGGFEVYGNTFNGGDTDIDIAGAWNVKGSYDYSWYIHDNTFNTTDQTDDSHERKIGIDLENVLVQDVWIYRNHFVKKPSPINVTNGTSPNAVIERIWIAYNIFEQCGSGTTNDWKDINTFNISGDMHLNDFYFINNVIIGRADAYFCGFNIDNSGTISNMVFRNNIIKDFLHTAGWLNVDNNGSFNGLHVDHNILYNNANNNPTFSGNSVSNYTTSNNANTVPPFVSGTNFHLTAARNGVTVSLPTTWTDYGGSILGTPPEIGVYEYGASIVVPTLTTTSVTSITQTTASSGGNISSDGGATVTARGVCWATTSNPTIGNSKTTNGTGTGSFTSSITGLTQGTIYHVRAYATNSAGTAYGSDIQFVTTTSVVIPTVQTSTASNILYTSAGLGGNITNDGGGSIIERGICISTSPNPTTANKIVEGNTGIGGYTVTPINLIQSTLYYVRAYATNSVGTAYGSQVSFTTLTPTVPTLTTISITNITQTTASSGGSISSDNGSSVTSKGVCWNTSSSPTISNSKTSDGIGTGAYTSSITGLTSNTTYYVRSYATNSIGTSYGNEVSFITGATVPMVDIIDYGEKTSTSYVVPSMIISEGGSTVTQKGVCWSLTTNPTISDSHTAIYSGGAGTFSTTMTGLTPNTLYHFRVYAINSIGIGYSRDSYITTLSGWTAMTNQVNRWMCAVGGWFLPSKDELNAMYTELHLYGLGSFYYVGGSAYWTSSEYSATQAHALQFGNGTWNTDTKSTVNRIRACRSFTSVNPSYSVRDAGPSGGYIFYKDGDNYMETAPIDRSPSAWSNIISVRLKKSTLYGLLYNGYAYEDLRNIAPIGWHVPSNDEWSILDLYTDPIWNGDGGDKLKEVGTVHWDSPNTGANNETGFTGLPGGMRGISSNHDQFSGFGSRANFGSSDTICHWILMNIVSALYFNSSGKYVGVSLRCIRDNADNWNSSEVVVDYDGNEYTTVQIGTQIWLKSNLAVTHYRNGDPIPEYTSSGWGDLTTGALCAYWNDWTLVFDTNGTAIGTGQTNTNIIIAQIGHTTSAAKLCYDLP